MSNPKFYDYLEVESQSISLHYSQTVVIGNTVRTSGQGGWDCNGEIPKDPAKQVELAFLNIFKALQAVSPKLGWSNVYAVRSLHTNIEETSGYVISSFRQSMPNHRPIWTSCEITKLGLEGMVVEIEVEAILP